VGRHLTRATIYYHIDSLRSMFVISTRHIRPAAILTNVATRMFKIEEFQTKFQATRCLLN